MLKYFRYALATFCFAASVGCLALWWRSLERWEILNGPLTAIQGQMLNLQSFSGTALVLLLEEETSNQSGLAWTYTKMGRPEARHDDVSQLLKTRGPFGSVSNAVFFPLWYPALIFALTGVGILRVGRFTIRSAIIATTVVAVLLGMAVIL